MPWVIWADRNSVRHLFIVSRAKPELFNRLAREFGGDNAVRVILDRRSGESRPQARATLPEQGQQDRRVRTGTADELRTRGCAIVSVQ